MSLAWNVFSESHPHPASPVRGEEPNAGPVLLPWRQGQEKREKTAQIGLLFITGSQNGNTKLAPAGRRDTVEEDDPRCESAPEKVPRPKVSGAQSRGVRSPPAFRPLIAHSPKACDDFTYFESFAKPSPMMLSPLSSCSSVMTRGIRVRMTLPRFPHDSTNRPFS